ncbi:CoA-transferase [Nocardia amamiensis]|uniref:CoA-transferase n=1 Tax=Nocardia amamiensis TaxID=404578 RepID=UPI0033D076D2
MSPRIVTAEQAADLIPDGSTVAVDGFTMMGVAEEVYAAIERSFLASGHPHGLILVHASGQSNRAAGLDHFAHRGLVARVVGSHWGLAPRMSALLGGDAVPGVCLPQGQLSTLYRAIAAGRPGNLSTVGIATFVDPRVDGGRINHSARGMIAPNAYVDVVTLDGRDYLRYKSFPIDVGILRASAVDEAGNASQSEEASGLDALSLAQAVRNSGGFVICQAKQVVPRGAIAAREVSVPGTLIDYIVPVDDVDTGHRQTDSVTLDRALVSGFANVDELAAALSSTPVTRERARVGERGARLVEPGDVINVGTGIPGDTIGGALARAGLLDQVTMTIESGVYDGLPLGGTDFGAARNPSAIIGHAAQFDFYNGGGADIAFMGAGQVSGTGDVNVSVLGGRVIGCGGFIDILDGARRICFLLSAGGRNRKFVDHVDHPTFSGQAALAKDQQVYLATEDVTLRLTAAGWVVHDVDPSIGTCDVLRNIPILTDSLERSSESKE